MEILYNLNSDGANAKHIVSVQIVGEDQVIKNIATVVTIHTCYMHLDFHQGKELQHFPMLLGKCNKVLEGVSDAFGRSIRVDGILF